VLHVLLLDDRFKKWCVIDGYLVVVGEKALVHAHFWCGND